MVKVETVIRRKTKLTDPPYYKILLQDMALGRHIHIDRITGEVLEEIEIKEV